MQILYEDNHILVAVKPQNVPTQADDTKDLDILTQVREYIRVKYNKPGNVYVGLVHRLDRPTGGVMVFAKTSKAASRLSEAIAAGTDFEKRYYAVVVGRPRERADTINSYLLKDTEANTVSVVPAYTEGAKYAELSYRTLLTAENVSLLDVKLGTGRSHQIRVQLKSIGCPVFGDIRYGGDSLAKGHNMALWAYELRFCHPVTRVTHMFRAAPPIGDVPWSTFKELDALFNNITSSEDAVRVAIPMLNEDGPEK